MASGEGRETRRAAATEADCGLEPRGFCKRKRLSLAAGEGGRDGTGDGRERRWGIKGGGCRQGAKCVSRPQRGKPHGRIGLRPCPAPPTGSWTAEFFSEPLVDASTGTCES